jgi:2,3-bisphosphoglycerate-dependent phosphoglycerate mutase
MKTTTIALIRHGAYHQPEGVPSALLPHPLTEEGHDQAKAGARELKQLLEENKLSAHSTLYSSTSLRAYQTGTLIREFLELSGDLETTDGLCERSVGPMANLTVSEIEEVLRKDPRYEVPKPGWKSTPNFKLPYPGAESLLEAGKRVADTILEKTSQTNTKNCTIFVGHGASFRFACYHLGLWSVEEAQAHSMFYGRPVLLRLENGTLKNVGGSWKVRDKSQAPKD